jgi:hypothetical protein
MRFKPIHLVIAVFMSVGTVLTGGAPVSAQDAIESKLIAAVSKLNADQKAALQVLVSGLVGTSTQSTVPATLATLSPEQKSALLVLLNGIVAGGAQESPEEGAMKTVKAYVKAAEDADVETLMAQVSENFNHYEAGNKAGLKAFVERVKSEGMLEDISGNTADARTTVEGDVVRVYPVELEGIFGTVTYEFQLKKEGDVWKIVGFEMSGD